MIWSILPYKDTTLYEKDETRNTGLDQINELRLELKDSNYYESRILMSFDTNKINNYLNQNAIDINDVSASLNIRVVQSYELPFNYEIGVRPIAQDWVNGTGYITGNRISNGSTWELTSEVATAVWTGSVTLTPSESSSLIYNQVSGSLYKTGSYDTVINYNTVKGGGSWYIDSGSTGSLYCYQAFDYKSDQNINVDVSPIVKLWLTGSIPNYGFIIYLNKVDSNTSASILFNDNTMIQTYGTETDTIYSPTLTIYNTPSQSYSPSNDIISPTGSIIVYQKNFNGEVKYNTKHKFILGVRPQYPRPAFAQNTVYRNSLNLPSGSYYQITDAVTHDVIIPYSQYTIVDTVGDSSFIEFYTNMLYPERYYNIELKTEIGSEIHYITSPEFTFKVIR
jgi:hypothetical protein